MMQPYVLLMNELDDLIYKCKCGNRGAMEKIYKLFSSKMYALCLRLSRDQDDAKDNLQDGFIKVFDSIKSYKNLGSFEGWIKKIITNICLEKIRKSKNIYSLSEMNLEISDEEVSLDFDTRDIGIEKLREFVYELPHKYRLVFTLYVLEDFSHKQIALSLGISEGTSKSNLSRARDLLKRKINDYKLNLGLD